MLCTLQVNEKIELCREDYYAKIIRVVGHWGCPDPEIKLIPPCVFSVLDKVIASRAFTHSHVKVISMYALTHW
jgi:hypothetical protein